MITNAVCEDRLEVALQVADQRSANTTVASRDIRKQVCHIFQSVSGTTAIFNRCYITCNKYPVLIEYTTLFFFFPSQGSGVARVCPRSR